MSPRRVAVRRCVAPAVLSLALVLPTGWSPPVPPAAAAPAPGDPLLSGAAAFLASQQRPDGGFGEAEAGFPGFETPDVVLALAEAAQTTLVHDPAAALAAVRAVRRDGHDGLHYLDDLADAGISAGKAAQLVVVAVSVGLDPRAFDPDGDGPTDLVAVTEGGRQPGGSYGTFNDDLQVVIAHAALDRPVPAGLLDAVAGAQQANGGWSFTADPSGTDEDVDTTSRAVLALVAGGRPGDRAAVDRALDFLAARHGPAGGWHAFGQPDPNSTAMAVLAITAAGFDVTAPCWKQGRPAGGASPAGAGRYVSPEAFLRASQAADGHVAGPGDAYGVSTFATSQAVQALVRVFQPLVVAARRPCPATGYRLATADGAVLSFDGSGFFAATTGGALNRPVVGAAATPTGAGHWLFAADGGVFTGGDAGFFGSAGDLDLNQPVVGGAATPSGRGYWLFAADGGVFSFGDAAFLGSAAGIPLRSPVVGGAATPRGTGYWLVAADGGVFSFGDAAFEGSAAGLALNAPVVAGAATLSGRGYHLFAADGGVLSFGDAAFAGSAAESRLNAPVVAGFAAGAGGYVLAAADGGVFSFGDAPFLGSAAGEPLTGPVVAAAG